MTQSQRNSIKVIITLKEIWAPSSAQMSSQREATSVLRFWQLLDFFWRSLLLLEACESPLHHCSPAGELHSLKRVLLGPSREK